MKSNFKPVFNEDRHPLHEMLPLDTPLAVAIAPSQMCNINCEYCLHSLSHKELEAKGFKQVNMSWEIFTKTVQQLKAFPRKIKSISVTGQGEPLCNPRFAEMVSTLKSADVAEEVSFITNALLLDQKKSKAIIDAGIDRMFVSLQGITAAKYEEVCGRKINFDTLVENLTYFYEYSRNKCKVNIKIADVALEDGDEERFKGIFGNIADRIHIETIKPLYADVDYTDLLGRNLTEMTTTRFGRQHIKQKACYLSFYMLRVDSVGEIAPCGAPFHPFNMGNVNETTLLKAWNSEARREFLLSMLKGERFANPVCKDCDYPNDVPTENDEIDPWADELIEKFSKGK